MGLTILDTNTTLRQLREQAGLSQADVAKAMSRSQSSVSIIERDTVDVLKLRVVTAYLRALGYRDVRVQAAATPSTAKHR